MNINNLSAPIVSQATSNYENGNNQQRVESLSYFNNSIRSVGIETDIDDASMKIPFSIVSISHDNNYSLLNQNFLDHTITPMMMMGIGLTSIPDTGVKIWQPLGLGRFKDLTKHHFNKTDKILIMQGSVTHNDLFFATLKLAIKKNIPVDLVVNSKTAIGNAIIESGLGRYFNIIDIDKYNSGIQFAKDIRSIYINLTTDDLDQINELLKQI